MFHCRLCMQIVIISFFSQNVILLISTLFVEKLSIFQQNNSHILHILSIVSNIVHVETYLWGNEWHITGHLQLEKFNFERNLTRIYTQSGLI